MNKRRLYAALTLFFGVAGGFLSFFITSSQAQFASLNYLLFALSATVAAVGLLVERRKSTDEGISVMALIGGAFLLWALLSSLLSGRFATTILGMSTSLVGFGALACFALLGAFGYRYRDEVRVILGYSAPVVAVACGLYGVFAQPVQSADGTILDGVHLGFANSSEFALFLVLLVPLLLKRGYPYFKNDTVDRVMRYLIVVFILVAMFWNGMRMALLVVVAICTYYALCELVKEQRARRRVEVGIGVVAALGAVGLFIAAVGGRIGGTFLSIRGQLWRMALSEIAQRPLLGYGADGFFDASATIAKSQNWWGGSALHLTDGTTDPHNILVLTAVSCGVVGALLLIALFVLWTVRAFGAVAQAEESGLKSKSKKNAKKDATKEPLAAFRGEAVSVFAAGALLLTMPTTVNLLPLIALCAGSALNAPTESKVKTVKLSSPFAIVSVLGVSLGLIVVLLTGANAVARLALGPVTYLSGPSFERAYALNRYFGWDPFIAHELNVAYVYSTASGEEAASEDARMVALSYDQATARDDMNPYYRLMYINVLYSLGQTSSPHIEGTYSSPEALRFALLKQASADFPRQPDIDIELALSAINAQDFATAKTALKTVTDLGEYGQQIWSTPLKNAQQALDEASK